MFRPRRNSGYGTTVLRRTAVKWRELTAASKLYQCRFLEGLAPNTGFFVTTRLRNGGHEEQLFVAVDSISAGYLFGPFQALAIVIPTIVSEEGYRAPSYCHSDKRSEEESRPRTSWPCLVHGM